MTNQKTNLEWVKEIGATDEDLKNLASKNTSEKTSKDKDAIRKLAKFFKK